MCTARSVIGSGNFIQCTARSMFSPFFVITDCHYSDSKCADSHARHCFVLFSMHAIRFAKRFFPLVSIVSVLLMRASRVSEWYKPTPIDVRSPNALRSLGFYCPCIIRVLPMKSQCRFCLPFVGIIINCVTKFVLCVHIQCTLLHIFLLLSSNCRWHWMSASIHLTAAIHITIVICVAAHTCSRFAKRPTIFIQNGERIRHSSSFDVRQREFVRAHVCARARVYAAVFYCNPSRPTQYGHST